MCEVRSRKNGQEPKKKKEKKSTVVSSKKKSTVMSPIRRRMKKRNPSSGQNGQLVHWWLLIHSGHVFSGNNTYHDSQNQYRLQFDPGVDGEDNWRHNTVCTVCV
jgi:hypothetical protein